MVNSRWTLRSGGEEAKEKPQSHTIDQQEGPLMGNRRWVCPCAQATVKLMGELVNSPHLKIRVYAVNSGSFGYLNVF